MVPARAAMASRAGGMSEGSGRTVTGGFSAARSVTGKVKPRINGAAAAFARHSAASTSRHYTDDFSDLRRFVFSVVENQRFKISMAFVIAVNTCFVVYETDRDAACLRPSAERCDTEDSVTMYMDWIFLIIYIVEMAARIFAIRLDYFLNLADLYDGTIVVVCLVTGLFLNDIPGLGVLRAFRIAKVARNFKIITSIPEVGAFVKGMLATMRCVLVGASLILAFVMLWAIAAVILVDPVNAEVEAKGIYAELGCARCGDAYSSVWQAFLTLMQTIVFGDSWGVHSLYVIENQRMTIAIFFGAFFSIIFGLSNLVIAVIIERALENRDRNVMKEAENKRRQREGAKEVFIDLCEELDTDHSRTLSLQEMLDAYDNIPAFQSMLVLLDVQREDLEGVYQMMDANHDGEVDYAECAHALVELKTMDQHTMLTFVKFYVQEMYQLLCHKHKEEQKGPSVHHKQDHHHQHHHGLAVHEADQQQGAAVHKADTQQSPAVPKADQQGPAVEEAGTVPKTAPCLNGSPMSGAFPDVESLLRAWDEILDQKLLKLTEATIEAQKPGVGLVDSCTRGVSWPACNGASAKSRPETVSKALEQAPKHSEKWPGQAHPEPMWKSPAAAEQSRVELDSSQSSV